MSFERCVVAISLLSITIIVLTFFMKAVETEERSLSARLSLWPALFELQSIASGIATVLIVAATIALSVYLHRAQVALIVVSILFILSFIINLLIRLHRQRNQDWFVVRKCRTHLEAFEKQIYERPPITADFAYAS